MSWIEFKKLIDESNGDPSDWQSAIDGNPNTPQDALKVAIMQIIDAQDMIGLENLCAAVIGLARRENNRNLLYLREALEEIENLGAEHPGSNMTIEMFRVANEALKRDDGILLESR